MGSRIAGPAAVRKEQNLEMSKKNVPIDGIVHHLRCDQKHLPPEAQRLVETLPRVVIVVPATEAGPLPTVNLNSHFQVRPSEVKSEGVVRVEGELASESADPQLVQLGGELAFVINLRLRLSRCFGFGLSRHNSYTTLRSWGTLIERIKANEIASDAISSVAPPGQQTRIPV